MNKDNTYDFARATTSTSAARWRTRFTVWAARVLLFRVRVERWVRQVSFVAMFALKVSTFVIILRPAGLLLAPRLVFVFVVGGILHGHLVCATVVLHVLLSLRVLALRDLLLVGPLGVLAGARRLLIICRLGRLLVLIVNHLLWDSHVQRRAILLIEVGVSATDGAGLAPVHRSISLSLHGEFCFVEVRNTTCKVVL